MGSLFQDTRYAIRQLIRTPGFTCAAIFALALGIGANVAIFSTIDAVLLNSLPFRSFKEPQRLMSIYESNPALLQFIAGRLPVRFKNFLEWRRRAHSFTRIEAYQDVQLNLTSASHTQPEQVQAASATDSFLPLLGVTPRIGRGFSPSDSDHVAVISDDLWRSRFSSDPQIVGKSIRASAVQYQIIGVLPPAFELPAAGQGLDQSKPKLWIPMHLHPTQDEENGMALSVIGRLKPDSSLSQARAEMQVIANRLAAQHPDTNRGWGINIFPTISDDVDPAIGTSLVMMQFAVGFVLLIACANVANLLLTKAVSREKEMAVRVAIGATRLRLVRQNLTESLVLSFVGGVLGFLLSLVLMRLVSGLAPKGIHGFHELSVNSRVLAFALGVTLLSGILFGLAPSWHAVQQGVAEALSKGSRSVTGSSRRFRAALIVLEIALSLVLLIGAGLTIRSLSNVMLLDKGFQIDHLLTMGIALPGYQYKTADQIAPFNDQLLARVQQLPGVRAASVATALPMRSISESSYEMPGVLSDPNHMKVTDWARVTSGHVKALGLHLLQGRDLTNTDVSSSRPDVALVNESFARTNWPNQNPLGKVFLFGGEDGKQVKYTIVGVVSNAHQFGPDADSHIEIYLPGHHMSSMYLLVRTTGDPLSIANAVKQQVWALDKDQPVSSVDSMENMLSEWIAPRRFTMTIMIAFGLVALISAAVGLYSVLAYAVSLRTREIGVRVALGADPKQVAGMILREGIGLAVVGVVIGLAGAIGLAGFMQSLIFGMSPFDAPTFLGVSVLLAAVAMLASYLPARRASHVDPIEALRAE